jgi:hypothetical protein
MADRYIRRVLTVIAFALSVLAVQSISAGLLHTHAQVKAHRQCFWTIVLPTFVSSSHSDRSIDHGALALVVTEPVRDPRCWV